MRIEMLGPPTAGKSTLVRNLRGYGIQGDHAKDGGPIPAEWKPFVADIRRMLDDSAMFPKRPKTLPDKIVNALGAALRADALKQPVVIDEGVVQCGLSIAIRAMAQNADPDASWRYYLERIPLPALIVSMSASDKVLWKRNRRRGPARDHPKKTQQSVEAMPRILDILHSRGANIIEFDTTAIRPPVMVSRIAKEILAQAAKDANA